MTPGMSVNDIKAELARRGLSQAGIARKLGVSRSTVTLVILRGQANAEVRRAIAHAIDRPYGEVWGEEDSVRISSTDGCHTGVFVPVPPPPVSHTVRPRWKANHERAQELTQGIAAQLADPRECDWEQIWEWSDELLDIAASTVETMVDEDADAEGDE